MSTPLVREQFLVISALGRDAMALTVVPGSPPSPSAGGLPLGDDGGPVGAEALDLDVRRPDLGEDADLAPPASGQKCGEALTDGR